MSLCRRLVCIGLACIAMVCGGLPALSQDKPGLRPKPKPPAKAGAVRTTTVELVLLVAEGGGLQAQQWRSALEPLNISIAIRSGLEDEKVETTEKVIGTLRTVKAVGKLERSGKLVFADHAFAPGERQKLKQWVDDLATYGAQGTPDGKPLWGLTDDQFAAVYDRLLEVTKDDPRTLDLEQAVRKLPLPSEFPVRWTDAAQKRLARSPGKKTAQQNTQGFAAATALAVMLNDHGLGFRPGRTPGGDLELVIDVPEGAGDAWPIGWPLKLPRQKAAPKLFVLEQVYFEETPLAELLAKAAQAAEIPILFDYADLDRNGIEWTDLQISYPPRQATWHTVIRDALNKGKLSFDLWQDEIGQPFLYVTSIKSKRNAAPGNR